MKLGKPLAFLGVVGVVAALVVAGTAFAQTPTPAPGQQARTGYHEFFLDRLAAALDTTRDKLNSALVQARNETVDQQVKDGRLTQEKADRIKSQEGIVPFAFGFRGFDRGGMKGGAFVGGSQVRDAIAQALGMTPEELANQLRSGKSLAELAQGKEQAVKDAIVAAMKPQLDQAVQDGRITRERADQILEQVRSSDLSKLGGHWAGGWFKGKGERGKAPTPTP